MNRERVDTLNNLAQMVLDEGEEDAALKLFTQARELGEKQVGATDLSVAYSLNGLALINERRGNIAEALALFERSLAILENRLGPSHPHVAEVLSNISALVESTGDTNRALSMVQKALAIQEKALPPTHPDIAVTLNNLAVLSFKQGKLIEAENLLQKSIAITDAAIGPDNPDSCARLENLGIVEIYEGRRFKRSRRIRRIYETVAALPRWANNLPAGFKRIADSGGNPIFTRLVSFSVQRCPPQFRTISIVGGCGTTGVWQSSAGGSRNRESKANSRWSDSSAIIARAGRLRSDAS